MGRAYSRRVTSVWPSAWAEIHRRIGCREAKLLRFRASLERNPSGPTVHSAVPRARISAPGLGHRETVSFRSLAT